MSKKRRLGSLRSERGQVLPLVVIAAVVLIGFTGLAIDLGRVWVAKQQLQRAVDAATLAAGQDLPDSATALSDAQLYAADGTRNPMSGWGVTAKPPSITFECNTSGPGYTKGSTPTCLTDSSGDNCHPSDSTGGTNGVLPSGATTCNEVHVSEQATVTTGLLSLFIPSFTVTANSTAAARGSTGLPNPTNIFVILDTTGSMTSSCSGTVSGISSPDKLDCAKAGVRALLQSMPLTNGTADDEVGIAVFPAISSTLTGSTTTSSSPAGQLIGSATKNSQTMSVTANATSDIGDTITGTGIPTGATISAANKKSPYTVTLSNAATSTTSNVTYSLSTSTSSTTYSLPTTPAITPPDDETDCNGNDSFSVTYPPFTPYTFTASGTGGIPSSALGNFANYTSPGYVDNFPGYVAVPLSSDYQTTSGSLNLTSNIVESVDWNQCSGNKYPGGDYYGIKDIAGQGSYLAGAISEAQYTLATQPQTRTINGTSYPVTNAIVILSDGEMNDPKSGSDGVDPNAGTSGGNVGFASSTPCEDAYDAAQAAKADNTLIFSIAYDDSGGACDDGGNGTGPSSLTSCSDPTVGGTGAYSGSGPYDGSACSFLNYLDSGTTYFASQSTAGDLTTDFTTAANVLTGNSVLTPECANGNTPPNC